MGNIARPPCDEAAILAGSCTQPATKNGTWILAATILGSSMAFIDGTVVNVALPALQSALHATLADVQWVVESYALFLAAIAVCAGRRRHTLRWPLAAVLFVLTLAQFPLELAAPRLMLITLAALCMTWDRNDVAS